MDGSGSLWFSIICSPFFLLDVNSMLFKSFGKIKSVILVSY